MERTKTILGQLLAIDSTFEREAEIVRYARGLFEGRGFRIAQQRVPSYTGAGGHPPRHNLIVERGEPRLFFFGHLDTVSPAGGAGSWRHPPFAATEEEGRIHGLGAVDMKSGVAAFIAAVLEADPPHVGLCLTCDEEGKFLGVKTLVESGLLADRRPELAVFAEPTDLALVNTHRGCVELALEARGRAAHAAMPQLGRDASRLYSCLQALRAELQREHPGTHLNVGYFAAGALDAINVVPDRAEAVVDIRPDAALQRRGTGWLAERLQALAAAEGLALETRVNLDMQPLETPPERLAPLAAAVAESGIEVRYGDLGGTSEAGEVSSAFGFPCVNFGPGPKALSHQVDEHVELASLAATREVFGRLVAALCF